jgi:penicillin-binding protein 1A
MNTTSPGLWPVRILKAVLVLGTLGMVALLALAAFFSTQLPDTSSLSNYQPKQPLRVLTADGVEIAGFGTERRVYKPIDQIPRLMKDSLLAVEDSRFYEHGGLDPIGVARALVANLTGGRTQGASTITQQVARTFFLSRSRTLERKLKEAMLAYKIESQLSKDQILELYMNQIYLGARAYGFEAAAQAYFGKTLSALSAAECAMLAGLPQNPYFANPIQNWERARARQMVVLGRMRSQDVITDAEFQAAKAEKLIIRKRNEVDVHAEHVAEMVRQQVYAQFGENSYTTGFNVTTTLRAADQQAAYKALRRTLVEHSLRQVWRGPEGQENLAPELKDEDPAVAQALADYDDDEDLRVAIVTRASSKSVTVVLGSGEVLSIDGAGLRPAQSGLGDAAAAKVRVRRGAVVRVVQQGKAWSLVQWPEAEGALVAMDPANGEIRALVGGFDFHRNQFNHVTQGWRQPGSSYKPFIYSAAIESGMQPESLVNDAPMENVGDWSPENDDGSADGPITLRRALVRSKNLVSIRLMQLLSPEGARQWAARFGFDPERQPDNLTQALGSGSTNPLQMAGAYSVLANGGYRINPVLIRKIERASGELVFAAPPQVIDESLRTVPARNTFMVSSLLQEVTRSGTAAKAQATLKRPDLYGKTGTTNDVFDAWFAGYQPGVVAVVWVGYDTPRSLGNRASGSALALPAWIEYMSVALQGVPVQEVQPPEGVVRAGDDWRYAEWSYGGFIESLGVDGQAVSPALAVRATMPEAPAPAPSAP